MDDFPEELVSSILSRLSVKDLLRLKVTCKRWNYLILDRHFVEEHAGREKFRAHTIFNVDDMLYTMVGCYSLVKGHPWTKNSGELPHVLLKGRKIPTDASSPGTNESHQVVGSCNGLVLLQDYDKPKLWLSGRDSLLQDYDKPKLWLWNPTTREIRKIRGTIHCLCHFTIVYGFGYDRSPDDYKIVMIQQWDGLPRIAHVRS